MKSFFSNQVFCWKLIPSFQRSLKSQFIHIAFHCSVKRGSKKKAERGDKELGKRIKKLRVKKYPTQEDFSIASDVSPTYISQVENGISSPSHDVLKKIAKALDITVSILVDTDADENNNSKSKSWTGSSFPVTNKSSPETGKPLRIYMEPSPKTRKSFRMRTERHL